MEPRDWFKLAELGVIFVFIGGFLAWEWWRTQKLIKADRAAAMARAHQDDIKPD
jgi:hypothetical protein